MPGKKKSKKKARPAKEEGNPKEDEGDIETPLEIDKKKKKLDPERDAVHDNIVEDEKAMDVSIDIDGSPESSSVKNRSPSLEEIIVDSKDAPKDNAVAIDIPDSPRDEVKAPVFPTAEGSETAEKIPSRPTSAEKFSSRSGTAEKVPSRPGTAEKVSSRPGTAEKVPSRPGTAEKVSSRPGTAEKVPSRPGTAEKVPSRLGTPEKVPSRPVSAEKIPSRPVSAEKIPSRPVSAEKIPSRPVSAEKAPSRPVSAEKIPSRPVSAEKVPSRPVSAEKIPSRPVSAEKIPSRPVSADNLARKSSRDNILPSLPEDRVSIHEENASSRPSSANNSLDRRLSSQQTTLPLDQRLPEEQATELEESLIATPKEESDVVFEQSQTAVAAVLERPSSSKVHKNKRSSKKSMDKEPSSARSREHTLEPTKPEGDVNQQRPVSPSKREPKTSATKRVSISNNVEETHAPRSSRENTLEGKRRELEPNSLEKDDNNNNNNGPLFQPPPPHEERRRSSIPVLEQEEDELPWVMYKKMKTRAEEEEEKDEEDNNEDDSDDNDSRYEPPTVDDLPNMYNAMDGLHTDEIELNLKTSPPSILQNDQQKAYQQQVHDLKQGLAEEEIKVYLDEFEQRIEEEILMIGNISLDDVQDEERRLREEHISFQQQQAKVQRNRQQEIMQAMERAKKYVMRKYKEKHKELRMREEHLMQKDRSYKDEIHRSFRRAESQLRKALKRRKAEVKTMYGDLTFADGQYGGSKGRRWKIDWNRAPQPIQIKLKCLRGVKDKLPGSRYVLMVSLYNRLGGNVMKWSNLKGQQWGGATLPLHHDGEFFNIEMKVDQSVFTVCPSKPDMLPGMVLIFELFILRGSVTPTDKVVGWGCFPICDADFNVIEGKYKTPMLRGDMDPALDNFQTIEKLMADDLEHWLCNFYFEIVKLPRYMAGQKEYEVELQFTSGLLSSPDRTHTTEENIDGEKAIFGSKQDMNSSQRSFNKSRLSLRSGSISSAQLVADDDLKSGLTKTDSGAGSSSNSDGSSERKSSFMHDSQIQLLHAENLSVDLRKRENSTATSEQDEVMVRPMTSVTASRKLVEEKGLQLSDDDDGDSSGTDYDEDDIYTLKKNEGFKPVKGQPGMFYKIHHNTPSDVYAKKVYTLMPKTPLLAKQKIKKKLTHLEELNTHTFTVKTPWSNKGRVDHKGSRKVQYIARMLLTELGISQIKSRVFWAMILMLLVTFWIRMYLHYVGQWVALVAFQIPINKFDFLAYTVNLNYQNTLLRTREELALIVIGPFTVIFFFAAMVAISAFIQFLFDRFPNILSRFIMAFGMQCVFDPLFILIVDGALKRFQNLGGPEPIGDAFKLYWHFDRFYNNDNVTLFVSIALTLFLYFVTTFCACALLYVYFLKIHNNGRLMDVYWRLHSKEQDFFIPYDLEISNEELNYVARKAEQWRGEEGERRKTAVYDYIWEEEEMADEDWDSPNSGSGKKTGTKETTTHVSIHTIHLDGLRELYRHFLNLPDGAIVEVFGEMNIPGIDEGVKQALIKRTTFQSMNNSSDKNNNDDDGLRKRPSAVSSHLSVGKEDLREKKMSNADFLLGVPSSSSQV